MSPLKDRVKALKNLGHFFRNVSEKNPHYKGLFKAIHQSQIENGWFQKKSCLEAIQSWGKALQTHEIEKWISSYEIKNVQSPKTIALITAGNIPLVSLHDLISIWISGNNAIIKCSTKNRNLIPFLVGIDPFFQASTAFTDKKLENFDAVIATGSNNAARYFDHYFSKYPHIIRKNKNGVAVLNGKESLNELEGLGRDMLQYYGLGCRNVSKLYLPTNYDLNKIFGGLYPLAEVLEMKKYANNYDYNKAVYLMSEFDFLENGFFMLREEKTIPSPIATAHYEFYNDFSQLEKHLEEQKENIQCIVSNQSIKGAVAFGEAQNPGLRDYADGIDTLAFLNGL